MATESKRKRSERLEVRDVTVTVAFHNRANPAFIAARRALVDGELGQVRHGYLRLSNTTWVPPETLPWASHTSALWFHGSHGVDLLRYLLDDEVTAEYAVEGKGFLAARGVATDDFHLAILEFRDGAVITIEHSWILPPSQPIVFDFKVELVGESGVLYTDTSHNRVLEVQVPAVSTFLTCSALILRGVDGSEALSARRSPASAIRFGMESIHLPLLKMSSGLAKFSRPLKSWPQLAFASSYSRK